MLATRTGVLAIGDAEDLGDGLEAGEREVHLDVVLPDFLQDVEHAVGDHAHRHALDGGERAVGERRHATAAEEAIDEEVRELVPEVDDPLLSAGVLELERVGGAGRRERERELAERELLDALELQLHAAAHAPEQPALERLGEALVHGLQRPQLLLRDAVRTAEVIDLRLRQCID
jgi:hypothetical protein